MHMTSGIMPVKFCCAAKTQTPLHMRNLMLEKKQCAYFPGTEQTSDIYPARHTVKGVMWSCHADAYLFQEEKKKKSFEIQLIKQVIRVETSPMRHDDAHETHQLPTERSSEWNFVLHLCVTMRVRVCACVCVPYPPLFVMVPMKRTAVLHW